MRKEMINWKMLQLNPVELRKPSPILAKDFIGSDGSNLPAALARMKAEDSYITKDIYFKNEEEQDIPLRHIILLKQI